MILPIALKERSYDVVIEPGCLARAGELLHLHRRALIVTDSGVPQAYAEAVAAQCDNPTVVTIPMGERSKNLDTWTLLLQTMLDHRFTRSDCVIAVGGGVVGDLAGFAASAYMRGVDFYNIPTTVLSQVDSSIGGKTGVDFSGVKNIVGAFYQPKRVLIDAQTLATLAPRQIRNGLAEAIKMAACFDKDLFSRLELSGPAAPTAVVIEGALAIKKQVVEQDERERGLRKALNFGHTLGHGIESLGLDLYHGECVSLGMLPMSSDAVRPRLRAVLQAFGLPVTCSFDVNAAYEAIVHDKKSDASGVDVVMVEQLGSFQIRHVPTRSLLEKLEQIREDAI